MSSLSSARRRSLKKVQAARVSRNAPNVGGVGTNPAARSESVVQPSGSVRNRRAPKMTGAQRDSNGNRSAWAASPYFYADVAWSDTRSTMPRGSR